jgi:hypothetical protein
MNAANGKPSIWTFLTNLDDHRISYRLDRVRETIMVVVAIPGERWEIEFFENGAIEVERFKSDGTIEDGSRLDLLHSTVDP